MPRIPLKVALPAAVASLAYLNARHTVASDVWGIYNAIFIGRQIAALESQDRLNVFYRFEELARDPKTAHNPFLIVPVEPGQPQAKTQWTYAEAYEVVLKYAAWLRDTHRVQKNEIIAMDFKNRPQFIWLWFAMWSLGAMPAFINSNLRDNAFVHCVKISTARLLIIGEGMEDVLTDESRQRFAADEKGHAVDSVFLDSSTEALIEQLQPYRAPNEARSGAKQTSPSILIYTSGTTGLPKAANVNWAKPVSGALFFPKLLQLTPTDRYFTAMPLYHSSASVLGVCQALGPGCAVVVAPRFSPTIQMQWVSETKATVMQYIGEMCRYMVNAPPSPYDRKHNLRLAFGNGMRPDVWQKFKDRFNIGTICEFYGATEAPGASYVYSNNDFYRGAIGKAGILSRTLFGSASALVRHDHATDMPWRSRTTNCCARVDTNEPGELLYLLDPANIRDRFQGYLGNASATESKVLRDVFVKGDAWYRTGDLQRRDADGRWWFIDRVGDTFRWKGENVSTAEVSETLGAHPRVQEANVYGVALPNHDGRAGCAAIGVLEGGVGGKAFDDALAAELAQLARKRLPRYAVPLFIRAQRELEVTGTLKHQKVELRAEGVDPSRTGADEVWWLPPGAAAYTRFRKGDWERICGGGVKL